MKKKSLKLVISFHTTAEAMALDYACKGRKELGKMIPVPRQISAGCGIAWCTEIENRAEISALMKEREIMFEEMVELLL